MIGNNRTMTIAHLTQRYLKHQSSQFHFLIVIIPIINKRNGRYPMYYNIKYPVITPAACSVCKETHAYRSINAGDVTPFTLQIAGVHNTILPQNDTQYSYITLF